MEMRKINPTLFFVIIVLALSCTANAGPSTERLGGSGNVLPPSGVPAVTSFAPGIDIAVDGGFEGGTPNAAWVEASTNFGTPICSVGLCGTGTGTGPNNGLYWTWFGGISSAETGSVSQLVVIPEGSALLEFWTELIVCDSAADFMEARIDGIMVYRVQGDDAACGVLGYQMQSVSITAFADGGAHTVEFYSEIFANNEGGTNFFLDDVAIVSFAKPINVPSLQWYASIILIMLLIVFAYRRRQV